MKSNYFDFNIHHPLPSGELHVRALFREFFHWQYIAKQEKERKLLLLFSKILVKLALEQKHTCMFLSKRELLLYVFVKKRAAHGW